MLTAVLAIVSSLPGLWGNPWAVKVQPPGILPKSLLVTDGHDGFFAGKGRPYNILKDIYFASNFVAYRSSPVTMTKYGVIVEGKKVFLNRYAALPINLVPADSSGWLLQNYPPGADQIIATPTAISKAPNTFPGKLLGGVTELKDVNGGYLQVGMTQWEEYSVFSPTSFVFTPPYPWGTVGRVEWTNATEDDVTAGYLKFPPSIPLKHAYYSSFWNGGVDVHPAAFSESEILALQRNIAVGYVKKNGVKYPYYWDLSSGARGPLGSVPGIATDTIAGNFALLQRGSNWVIWQIDTGAFRKLIWGSATVTAFRLSGSGNYLYVSGKAKDNNPWESAVLWSNKVTGTPSWP